LNRPKGGNRSTCRALEALQSAGKAGGGLARYGRNGRALVTPLKKYLNSPFARQGRAIAKLRSHAAQARGKRLDTQSCSGRNDYVVKGDKAN
jgi:hypothetical protein